MNRVLQKVSIVLCVLYCGHVGPLTAVANACSCADPVVNTPQGVGVPLDSKVWLRFVPPFPIDPGAYHLLAPTAKVDTQLTTLGDMVVLKPRESLAPMTVYRAFHCTVAQTSFEDLLGCEKILEFTTGDGTTKGIPEVPKVIDREEHYVPGGQDDSSCGSQHAQSGVSMTYQTAGELILFDFGTSQFDPQSLTGTIDYVASSENFEYRASYGNFACSIRSPNPNQDSITVRVGALDLAGHFSGWSQPETITMPKAGCTLSGTQDRNLWLGAGLLGFLTWRRRARASRLVIAKKSSHRCDLPWQPT